MKPLAGYEPLVVDEGIEFKFFWRVTAVLLKTLNDVLAPFLSNERVIGLLARLLRVDVRIAESLVCVSKELSWMVMF